MDHHNPVTPVTKVNSKLDVRKRETERQKKREKVERMRDQNNEKIYIYIYIASCYSELLEMAAHCS